MNTLRSGFTLLEMSIVLAIIGLLAGGIMLGNNLVREQQVRSLMEDATTYSHAIYQFKDKYGEMPGDFDRATSVWGSDASACTSALDATNGTCNGNGNGTIDGGTAAGATGENFQAWRQLLLAGMVQGTFTGTAGAVADDESDPGSNVPAGGINSSGVLVYSWGYTNGDSDRFLGNYDNALYSFRQATSTQGAAGGGPHCTHMGMFGHGMGGGCTVMGVGSTDLASGASPLFTGKEAYELDSKSDDGQPGFGNIRTPISLVEGSCVSDDVAATAIYLRDSTQPACNLYFLKTFGQEPSPST